ncbi:hypothetical protein [Actinoplanes sp. NPDC049599]|uniref:hypothetical protein n=1 Tax=Actinoplanes sp. NPDC049599 TaxID=3363903 RepID=UPI00378CBCCF
MTTHRRVKARRPAAVLAGDAVLGEIRRVQRAGLSEGGGEDAPVEAGLCGSAVLGHDQPREGVVAPFDINYDADIPVRLDDGGDGRVERRAGSRPPPARGGPS